MEDLLTPERLTKAPDAKDRAETLFRLGVALGTDRLVGGFRGFSVNLDPRPEPADPLFHALVTLLTRAGAPPRRGMTFGNAYAPEDPHPLDRLRAQVAAVPADLHLPLARLVLNLIEAREWIDLGLRKVTPETRREIFAALETLATDTPDGTGYHPAFDDAAAAVDAHSLYYGCLKALQAVQDARRELPALPAGFSFALDTPWGAVVVGDAPAWVEAPLLYVGAAPTGPVAATGEGRTLSVALLTGGDAEVKGPAGRGILGAGILYAAGEATNRYAADDWALGSGVFGLGAIVDEGGDDFYEMASSGEGAGFFGIGLLLDAAGNDRYSLGEGDGQGFGGPAGIGVLADRSGDDAYYCEPDAAKAGRGDYHSQGAVAVSNAQGVGSGRRGDGSDGHNWAGGLGALLDVDGNDRYEAGNFRRPRVLVRHRDRVGRRRGRRVSKRLLHAGLGRALRRRRPDRRGRRRDLHVLGANAGAAFGFGWDVVNAFLVDRGAGNDRYVAKCISTGCAEVRSNAFFLDEGGDDVYVLDEGNKGFGDVDDQETYLKPGRTNSFSFRIAQVGMFLDLGGDDRYLRRGAAGGFTEDPAAGDGREWNLRRRDPAARGAPNVSFGGDCGAARIGFFDPWPARIPGEKR